MTEKCIIQNGELTAVIKTFGAELCSVKSHSGQEFMWQAEPVWPRHAPNLFPIVGSLLQHQYTYEGVTYPMKHHGFARDSQFTLLHQSEHSASFVLQDSDDTRPNFPFSFSLIITYTLGGNTIFQRFRVINTGADTLPLSFGAHPAFNASPVDDFDIVFEKTETAQAQLLDGPYIGATKKDVIQEGTKIPLTPHTFDADALVFENLNSKQVTLQHKHSSYSVKVGFEGFPFLGIWAKPAAPFVCIEPWQGIADYVSHNGAIEHKKGIVWLDSKEEIERTLSMTFIAS